MKKVYGLLSIQLLTTIVISTIIMFTPFIRDIFIFKYEQSGIFFMNHLNKLYDLAHGY